MKINLCVIMGGKSVEHEISVITAVQAIQSLDKEKYEIIPLYITKKSEFYTSPAMCEIDCFKDIPALLQNSERVAFVRKGDTVFLEGEKKGLKKPFCMNVDAAFPIVHGTNVEDGTLAGFLNLLDLPYCGCDVLSAANSMDKLITKDILKAKGIPVLDATDFYADRWAAERENLLDLIEKNHRYPIIVKPVNLGSSVGVYKVKNREDLAAAIDDCFLLCSRVMIENAVENLREINCSVLGDVYEAAASPCEEPVGNDAILSYGDKYMSGQKGMSGQTRKLPADLPEGQTGLIQKYAVGAFKALGCAGVARVDFLTDAKTGEIYVNELNTIPGSLSFYLWEAAGLHYRELLDKIIALAFKRDRERKNLNFSFDTNILSGFSFGGLKK
ncbi:MAG TPA: D-alanine--D-alanine ligase family protein [Oscillospiraceae bacterium]|nr:D-alanine--D-alanine ligase family protein [Oscillospiraceae bacterium]HPS35325.1 D-alanine--D-alanine ligase family protein [Oscillospiraceae bacterium]